MKITGKEILELGYTQGLQVGLALESVARYTDAEEALSTLSAVLKTPADYSEDAVFGALAKELISPRDEKKEIALLEETPDYSIYGKEGIEDGALRQLNTAMRLPVTKAGALMPDAHQGYGLPIGGVLATENAVIPYGVGVDIGCRMCLTLFDVPTSALETRKEELKGLLLENTRFGRATFRKPKDHAVLEDKLFSEIKLVKELKDRAASQIGSSGGGNHFVEFGVSEIEDPDNEFGLPVGNYLALLSHSGSRGFGANIARHYTKLAMEKCQLPKDARHLAWLDLNTAEGQEYWLAMNLAGDYASACHHQIHDRMIASLGATALARVENHHNFAWKEQDAFGNEIIVHRKGATPAGKGVLGVIPGSMTAPGFIVRGKGADASINSASHGAGRAMSRTAAKKSLEKEAVLKHLSDLGVEVIGSDLDEAPMAYKNIHTVMDAQSDLVEVIGKFWPRIVRMCGDERFQEVD